MKTGTPPALSVADNVKTMALVEAGYRSIDKSRTGQAFRDIDQLIRNHLNSLTGGGFRIMMQAGIFTGYFPYGLEETAQKIRALDFNTVQLDLHFRDVDLSAGQITKDKARKCRDAFRDHNLPVCCVSGYTQYHPSRTKPSARSASAISRRSSATPAISARPYVISETGTYNTESDWVHHPKNKTEEGFEECRKVIADLAQTAFMTTARFSCSKPMSTMSSARSRETGEDVRAGRPSRSRPADGSDQLFRDPQHRPDGRDAEPGRSTR